MLDYNWLYLSINIFLSLNLKVDKLEDFRSLGIVRQNLIPADVWVLKPKLVLEIIIKNVNKHCCKIMGESP